MRLLPDALRPGDVIITGEDEFIVEMHDIA